MGLASKLQFATLTRFIIFTMCEVRLG